MMSNYTTGHSNTWCGCSTGVQCGSIPPNLFELHYLTGKHLVRVFHRCTVWFDHSEPLRTTLLDQYLVRVFYRCSVWFIPSEPLRTTLLHTPTLGEGVLQVFGVVRSF